MIRGTALVSVVERLLDESAANVTRSGSGEYASLEKGARRMHVTLVFILVGFVTIWLLCVGLIWHVKSNRAGALKGDAVAAKKVILPAFEPVLWVLGVLNGIYIVFLAVAMATGYFVSPLILESFYSGNQFMFVIVLVLMFQKSLSLPAVKRSVIISLVLSYYTLLYVWAVTKYGKPDQQKKFTMFLQFVRSLLMIPFVYAFVKPPSRATKRIIRELCVVKGVHFLLTVLLMIFIMNPKQIHVSRYVLYVLLTYVALCPLIVWRVFRADTEYWRGVGQRACALQDLFQRENGLSERISSEGLHVLIEMNRKCVIDFAYLELVCQLGVGSTSTVFQGILKTKTHVAVKAYSPTSCSEHVVAAFSHQAAMCSVLNHPNIVKFHGMCVAPPTICLVFQLCQGSLADRLSDQARRLNGHPARQQMLISVGYMLDAARAVAYLHSFSPPFVHRDIRPSNFLVDAECNVKLSDFGESRCLANLEGGAAKAKIAVLEDKRLAVTAEIDSPLRRTLSRVDSPLNSKSQITPSDYAAPEIINGKGKMVVYGVAADVFSLAFTMWDILHPSDDKFPQANGEHFRVQEMVMRGIRPKVKSDTPSRLRSIIERAWHLNPDLRPSAQQIVTNLEDVQEELSARLVLDLLSDLREDPLASSASSAQSEEPHRVRTYPGAFIIDRMIDRRLVRCPAEAVRMGNALMDANILHHVNHSRSFENKATMRYYFDLDEVQLSLPGVERSRDHRSSVSPNEHSIPMLMRGSNGGQPRTSYSSVRTRNIAPCRCRQLGQRLVNGKTSRFSRNRHFKAAPDPTQESNKLTVALLVDEDESHVDIVRRRGLNAAA